MTTTRLLPMVPPRGRARHQAAAVSVLLHLVLVAILLWVVRPPEEGGGGGAPSYQLVFEPPTAPGSAADAPAPPPTPAPPSDALPGPLTPSPDTMPDLAAPPSPPSTPAPEVPPQPTAPAQPSPPPQPAPQPLAPQPAPAEPAPNSTPDAVPTPAAPAPPLPTAPAEPLPQAEPEPFTPAIRLQEQPPPRILQPLPDVAIPPAPPAPPPPPAPPRPLTPPPPRQAPPPVAGTFAHPMDLSFAPAVPRPDAPRLAARAGTAAARSIDLSTGPARAPNRQEAFFDSRAARIGADWKEGLQAYWLRHRYYPSQAAEAGQDGQVEVELTVNRYGKVETVTVLGQSGSPFLDMAAVSVWRGAQLAPLPAQVAGDRITFAITIHYILLR